MRILSAAALAATLAGCADSVSAPEAMQAMPADQKASLKIANISADADPGIEMSDADFSI
ncbi:MAG: hypothetical protein JO261_14515, partial [Alphaproteobacteria bacterium]|nr:hypothetical protein [Alphaproteobacteria bacterium]